ncbi:hypothetical protein Vadar_032159 [Vaccinium darrowii]|uniref:Uncharacterized protein n=1 Tax=Vaccinium darrowii TaxID=229202 RepID=A0ACB7XEC7_9ERIC|nr:hypothetical protein Vadar_032159 [Vaccinium darrowii]
MHCLFECPNVCFCSVEVSGRGKLHSLRPSGRGQNELLANSLSANPGSKKEGGGNGLSNDASEGGNALKAPRQNHKSDNQDGNQLIRSKHPTVNGNRVRDADAPSPAIRDSSNPATNVVKEAKVLKHLADRLKNSGSSAESTGLYFQAALKFLHGASLLESSNGESAKQSDMIQSMQMYSSTAKLCEFCAHEYEKSKDMAAVALAYKCTEVAYMRMVEELMRFARAALTAKLILLKQQAGGLKIEAQGLLKNQAGSVTDYFADANRIHKAASITIAGYSVVFLVWFAVEGIREDKKKADLPDLSHLNTQIEAFTKQISGVNKELQKLKELLEAQRRTNEAIVARR